MEQLCCLMSYRGKDLADGSFNLEFSGPTVHVSTDHVGHRLGKKNHTDKEAALIYDILFISAPVHNAKYKSSSICGEFVFKKYLLGTH